jgi:general secretion pathway protein D
MTSRFARSRLAAGFLVLAGSLMAQAPNQGQQPRPAPSPAAIPPAGNSPDEMVSSFKLPDGDVTSMLDALEMFTGMIVIRPGTLPVSTYSLVIDHPVKKTELVDAILSELELNQIGVVKLGDHFLKVVPLNQAKAEAPEFIEGPASALPPSNRIASKVFTLQFLRAQEFFGGPTAGILTQGVGGGVVVMANSNSALVTDTVSNLQRIERLIGEMDQPAMARLTPRFFTLRFAKASDLVAKLHSVFSGPMAAELGSGTSYSADDRTNQVIVVADSREWPFFQQVIEKLDVKADPNTKNEVIFLKHADAQATQTVLSAIVSGQNAAAQKAAAQAQSVRPGENGNVANQPLQGGAAQVPLAPGQPQPAAPSVVSSGSPGGGSGNQEFSSLLTIAADTRSNSLVVSGTGDDISLIKELVEKIDVPLPQVAIEVIIAEVTLSDTDISGISSLGLTVGKTAKGATSIVNWAGGVSTTDAAGAAVAAATPGTSLAGWDFTGGVVNPLAFNAAFNPASAGKKSLVRILSAPLILTAHNKPGEITVGESVPIITGVTSSATAATSNGLSTQSQVTYQPIAITLDVTPLIGDNGDIQLNIDQKVNDIIGETTIDGNQQPTIGTREAKAWVTVKDGDMIVLGGLQRTEKSENHNKIGLLYQIPIISQLLGGHTDDLERTELLFFIRPHVITTENSTADAKERIDKMTDKQQVNDFLKNPTPKPKSDTQNFLDRFKNN